MLIFKTVSWRNFLSTGNVPNCLVLDTHSSTLIVGTNGEGKSTMLDALTFGLFGKPFRDVNKNQLINSINKKNCVVEIEFELNTRKYKIIRGIRPNIFEIYCDGDLINKDAALKDYQKVLEQQILRLNYKTFTQVIILGSSSFVPFMQLPTGQRREVIEDILDIRVFSAMNSILKEKIIETKDSVINIDYKVKAERVNIESQKTLIQTMVSNKQEVVVSLEAKIAENNNQLEQSKIAIETLQAEITVLRKKITKKEVIETNIDKARSLKAKTNHIIDSHIHDRTFFGDNDVCPSCSQDINEEYKDRVLLELDSKLDTNRLKIDELNDVIVKLHAQIDAIALVSNEISDKNIDISTHNNTITILNKQTTGLLLEIEQTKQNTGNIDGEKTKLKSYAANAIELITQKTELLDHRNLQDAASALLKDTGIKTAIIREYLPVMNKLINKYLNQMDSYIHFELDESFNETIKSRHRDEFTYASFSEGEKIRIDLAILFTWREIARMKNSVNTNLLILDEVFDGSLDSVGTDFFLAIMHTFGDNSNVFVISHQGDQLLDKFHSVIKFEKKNEFSVISTN